VVSTAQPHQRTAPAPQPAAAPRYPPDTRANQISSRIGRPLTVTALTASRDINAGPVVVTIGNERYHRQMTMTECVDESCAPTGRHALAPGAALFRSLGDETRLAILRALAGGEQRVRDLTDALGLAQSTVSAHLACLRGCGLIDSRPVGRQSFYYLTHPELLDLLATADALLAATGEAVALCPTYGLDTVTQPAAGAGVGVGS
jgi:DNA-binding transcriptional ArsR family regulator